MGVRKVRDAMYWGVPAGTPITPGMKPGGRAAAGKMAKAAAAPGARPGAAAAAFAAGAGKGRIHASTRPAGVNEVRRAVQERNAAVGVHEGAVSMTPSTTAADIEARYGKAAAAIAAKKSASGRERITGGDIVKVKDSGQELKVVREREHPNFGRGYDVQTGRTERDTTFFPESAVEKVRPTTLDDIRNERGTPEILRQRQQVDERSRAGLTESKASKPSPAKGTPRTAKQAFDTARAGDIAQRVRSATSRDAARSAVSGLSIVQLRQVAGSLGATLPAKATKSKIVDIIAEVAGRRLDSLALSRLR